MARFLSTRRSFIHLAIGSGLASFNGYAVISFFPSFMARSHAMSIAEIGVYLGLIIGIAGGIGFAGGGYVADRFGAERQRDALWMVSVATMVAWAFLFPMYLVSSPYLALVLLVVPTILSNFYLATTFAQVQGMVGLRMRAVASALLLFLLNIIGLGLGPQLTGILSDIYRDFLGDESLRYSLLTLGGIISPWSAFHYYMAGRHIENDLALAADLDLRPPASSG